MKFPPILSLLVLCPGVALGAGCNADNVLRALRANQAQASPFCSTYTQSPANQPLPTYVSQYPATRVASACLCLVTATTASSSTSSVLTTHSGSTRPPLSISSSSTSTPLSISSAGTTTCLSFSSSVTSTVSPTPTDACKSDRITNGNFQTLVDNKPASWYFAPKMQTPDSSTVTNTSVSGNNVAANLHVLYNNVDKNFMGTTTYIEQDIRPICPGLTYKLTYTSRLWVTDGSPRRTCEVRMFIGQKTVVHIGPPDGDYPPSMTETRETTFSGDSNGRFRVEFRCYSVGGSYTIDDISIVATS